MLNMEIVSLFLIMFGLMALGVPIGFSIAMSAAFCFINFTNIPVNIVAQSAITGLDSFPMLACPFFILAGALMSEGGLAKRLVNVMQAFFGHLTGGLSIATVVTCMFFGSISGSATATVSSVGGFMVPEMKKRGYSSGYCASLVSCAGSLGVFIPPSLTLVFYGLVTQTSITDLFIATVPAGVLITLAMCAVSWYLSKKYNYPKEPKVPLKQALKAVWDAKWALFCPVIILGGIYSGIFTATEAAIVAVVYALFTGVFVYRELTPKKIYSVLLESMAINGMIMFLLAFATGFAKYVTMQQLPVKIVQFISGITSNHILILFMINMLVLITGCVIDNVPNIMILSPILLPLAMQAGLTPVEFGVIISVNTSIGLVTPPYGADLFVGATLAKCKLEETFKTLMPMVIAQITCLLILTYFPKPMSWLVNLING